MRSAWYYAVNHLVPNKKLQSELDEAYYRVMSSGQYIGGYEVDAFENEWAEYCQAKYCVSCSSGQVALELLLKAFGIGFGDHVIVPSWTASPTWKAVLNVGARPRPIEPKENMLFAEKYNLIGDIVFSEKIKAILLVHLYGYRVNSDYPVWVIQDACQAHGLKGLDNAAFSFYPTKNLGAYGDGGAIVTNNPVIASVCLESKNSHRLDPLQAAFLRVKLKYLNTYNNIRAENAALYDELLNEPIIKPPKGGVYHQYVIRVYNRDYLKDKLQQEGIETMIHYPVPPHKLLGFDFDLPVADKLAQTVLSLPLMTSQENIKRIAEAISANY